MSARHGERCGHCAREVRHRHCGLANALRLPTMYQGSCEAIHGPFLWSGGGIAGSSPASAMHFSKCAAVSPGRVREASVYGIGTARSGERCLPARRAAMQAQYTHALAQR